MAASQKAIDQVLGVIEKYSQLEYDDVIKETGLSYSTARDAVGLLRTLGHVIVTNTRPALITFVKELPKNSIEVQVVEKEIPNPVITEVRTRSMREQIAEGKEPIAKAINEILEQTKTHKYKNANIYAQLVNAAEAFKQMYPIEHDELSPQQIAKRAAEIRG